MKFEINLFKRVGKIPFALILSLFAPLPTEAMSLFNQMNYQSLIADKRAYLSGDLLTVLVMETSNAQTSADLASNKEIKTALEGSYNQNHHALSLELSGKGNAAAKTHRQGKIKAALTVRIKTIQPQGSYFVEGEQLIRINGEQQSIFLSGIVRPEDISPQNTILSTRLANAKIRYTGNGSVSNAENHHLIYRVLSLVGLV